VWVPKILNNKINHKLKSLHDENKKNIFRGLDILCSDGIVNVHYL